MSDKQISPWEKQKGETSKAYEAFIVFRDLGLSRTYEEVSRRMRKSSVLIRKWAKKNGWNERILDFDRYLSEKMLNKDIESKLDQIEEMHRRQFETARSYHSLTRNYLNKLIDDVKADPKKYDGLADLYTMFKISKEAMELERHLAGEPTPQYIRQEISLDAKVKTTEQKKDDFDEEELIRIIDTLKRSVEKSGIASEAGPGEICESVRTEDDGVHSDKPDT